MERAYSRLETKALQETDDAYIISGIASTPRTDRMGDIVDPMGARFDSLPKLFLHHDTKLPIGSLSEAKPTAKGIPFQARIPKVSEAGVVKDRIDEAIHSIKYDLLSYVSIGFMPIESDPINAKDPWGGTNFKTWDWFELSVVGVPANPDAVITGIKSIDDELHAARIKQIKSADQSMRAASGDHACPVVRLHSTPGASGKTSINPEGKHMKTAETIASFEAKRAANVARTIEIQGKASEEGRSKDEAEKQEFDTLMGEIKSIDAELVDLREMEKQAVVSAKPVAVIDQTTGEKARVVQHSGIVSVGTRLEKGQKFGRYAIAMRRAHGNVADALAIVQANKGWMDTSPELALVLKTAVNAGDTTTAGWASELVYAQNLANEFIEYLRQMTIIGRVPGFRRVPFNVRMGSQTGGSQFYWTGQGKPILPSKLTTSSTSLGITKATGMVVVDDELVRSSSPSVELMIRDDLAAAIAAGVDLSFIDPNQGGTANVQPASLLYGVTPITPTGTTAAYLLADIKTLFSTMIAANVDVSQSVLVMSETTALSLSLMLTSLGVFQFPAMNRKGGELVGWPVIVSNAAKIAGSPQFGEMIVAINPREVFLADDDQVSIDISNEASIEMVDTSSQQSTATSAGAQLVSMFQTSSEAIRGIRYVNWSKRRASAAAFIQAAAYA